jgi:hypothetical protein
MAKLSKKQLKMIVKECLVEILQEGINPTLALASLSTKKVTRKKSTPKNLAIDNDKFESAVSNTVNALTDDPIMASIFADTAKTTLQEQYTSPGESLDKTLEAPSNTEDVGDVFGSAAQNWEALAFAEKKMPGV